MCFQEDSHNICDHLSFHDLSSHLGLSCLDINLFKKKIVNHPNADMPELWGELNIRHIKVFGI